jgi:5-methylcytosine-specific restriction endonuclease McrA
MYHTHDCVVNSESQWCFEHHWLSDHKTQDRCEIMALEYVPYDGAVVTRKQAQAAGLRRYFMGETKPCKRGHVSERKTVDGQCIECTRVHSMDEATLEGKRRRTKEWDDQHRPEKNAQSKVRYELIMATNPEKIREQGRVRYHRDPTASIARSLKWQAANQEQMAAYRAVNKEKIAETNRQWAKANPERSAARTQRWREKHPEKADLWRKENPEAFRAIKLRRRGREANAEGSHTGADIKRIGEAQRWRCHWCAKPAKKNYHVDHLVPLSKGGTNWPNNLVIACANCNLRKSATDPIAFAQRNGLLI